MNRPIGRHIEKARAHLKPNRDGNMGIDCAKGGLWDNCNNCNNINNRKWKNKKIHVKRKSPHHKDIHEKKK